MQLDSSPNSEAGSTLLEIVIAVLVLGTVVVGVVLGMSTSIKLSDYHRQRAEADGVLVSATERLKQVDKVACATPSTASYLAAARAAAVDEGWQPTSIQITSITYWNGSTYGATCYDNATNELPLQQITLRVTHPQGKVVQDLALVKGVG